MRMSSPLLGLAVLGMSACAQDGVSLRSGAADAAGLHPQPPSLSITPFTSTPRPPRVAAQYNSVDTSRRIIALTFDDGPHPTLTPKLLDILRNNGVRATFYVVGRNVEAYPDIARRIVAEGHEIANHTWTHPTLTRLGTSSVKREIESTSDVIQRVTGRRPTNMRPPYGAINARVRDYLTKDQNLDVIMWSVDPLDWKKPGSSVVTRRLVEGATPGGILLAHDIHAGTIEAMPATIAQLKAKGYGFVTVGQLLALKETKIPAATESEAQTAVQ